MKPAFVIVITALMIKCDLTLAQPVWVQTNGPYGGRVSAITAAPLGPIFIGCSPGGVYLSIDEGNFWHQRGLTDKYIYSLTIDGNGVLLAGTDLGVFRSIDGGGNWEMVLERWARCLSIGPSGQIWAGTYGTGTFRSTNNGISWLPVQNLDSARVNAISFSMTGVVYVSTLDSGVYRSTNDGSTWINTLPIRSTSVLVTPLYVFATTSSGVFKSSNGINWLLTAMTDYLWNLVMNANGWLFAIGYGNGAYRSTDYGNNWSSINIGLSDFYALSIGLTSTGNVLIGTEWDGLFRSTNNGSSWVRSINGITNSKVFCQAIGADGYLFAGTGGYIVTPSGQDTIIIFDGPGHGVFRSTDSGSNWIQYDSTLKNIGIYSLASKPGGIIFASDRQRIYRSTDNGISWHTADSGITGNYIGVVGIQPNGTVCASGNYFYISTNNGSTWQQRGLLWGAKSCFAFLQNGSMLAGGGPGGGGIFRSMDGGYNWWPSSTGLTSQLVYSLAANSSGGVFAATMQGVHRSSDNGVTWTSSNNGLTTSRILSIAINSDNKILVGSDSGVFLSTNNGDSWVQTSQGLTRKIVPSVLCNANGHAFAATYGGGVFRTLQPITFAGKPIDDSPRSFSLAQNYPNPFNPSTTIEFSLPRSTHATVKIYDLLGREVATLVNDQLTAGTHKMEWNVGGFASGVYFYRLQAGEFVETKKLLLLR